MKNIMLFLLGGTVFVVALMPLVIFLKFVVRGLNFYREFRRQGRLITINDIKNKYDDKVQFYLLQDLWIFNGIVFFDRVDVKGMSPLELRRDGLMIKKLYVTKRYIRKTFPAAKAVEGSLFYFD